MLQEKKSNFSRITRKDKEDVCIADAEKCIYELIGTPGCDPMMTSSKPLSDVSGKNLDLRFKNRIADRERPITESGRQVESAGKVTARGSGSSWENNADARGNKANAPLKASNFLRDTGSGKDFELRFRSRTAGREYLCSESSGQKKSVCQGAVICSRGNGDNNAEQLGMMSSSELLSAISCGKYEWGKSFQLRFGNSTASKECAKGAVQGSGRNGDSSAETPRSKTNEGLTTVVVRGIPDLLSYNPDKTIIEFGSEIDGKELGHLFRIAKILKFTRFVCNYTLARARLHYICSCYDGERRGRNLDAEAKEAFGRNKHKKK